MNTVGQHQRQFYRFIQLLLLMLTTTQTAYGSGIVTAPSTPFGPTEYTSFSFNAPCSRYTDPVTGSVSEQPFASISLLLSCLNRYPVYPVCATNPCYLLIPMSPLTYTSYPSKWYRTWCGYQYCAFGQAKPSCPAGYILPNLPAPQQANVCVANSMANASCNLGLTCICNPGFAPDASARSCVLQCQPGQQPNAAGTACVTPPPSTCPAGQVKHPDRGCMLDCSAQPGTVPNVMNTACIAHTCPIPPLTSLGDPLAKDFEQGMSWRPDLLTPEYQKLATCVADGFTKQGWQPVPSSAYRPSQYQQHFWELKHRYLDLTEDKGYIKLHPECQAFLNTLKADLAKHGIDAAKAVAQPGNSYHEKRNPDGTPGGQAFDITPRLLDANGTPYRVQKIQANGKSVTVWATPTQQQVCPILKACGMNNLEAPNESWHAQKPSKHGFGC